MQRRRLIHRRLIQLCFIAAGWALNLLPYKLAFLLLVVCEIARLPGRRLFPQAYRPYAVFFLERNPDGYFVGELARKYPVSSARVLFGMGAYRETCKIIVEEGLTVSSSEMTYFLTSALFELGEFKRARDAGSVRSSGLDFYAEPEQGPLKSMLDVVDGDEAAAVETMARASNALPRLMRPHQNLAARTALNYKPNYLDTAAGAPGRLFDISNFAGQRVTHVGHGEIGVDSLVERLRLKAICEPWRHRNCLALSPSCWAAWTFPWTNCASFPRNGRPK